MFQHLRGCECFSQHFPLVCFIAVYMLMCDCFVVCCRSLLFLHLLQSLVRFTVLLDEVINSVLQTQLQPVTAFSSPHIIHAETPHELVNGFEFRTSNSPLPDLHGDAASSTGINSLSMAADGTDITKDAGFGTRATARNTPFPSPSVFFATPQLSSTIESYADANTAFQLLTEFRLPPPSIDYAVGFVNCYFHEFKFFIVA